MSDGPTFSDRLETTLIETLGFESLEAGPEVARGRVEVTDKLMQPMGIVHGGVYCAIAESIVSQATFMAVYEDGNVAVGQSNHTSFIRPVSQGTINAEARRRHRGRTTWIWDVDLTDDQGRLCAVSRVTMAVRPAPR